MISDSDPYLDFIDNNLSDIQVNVYHVKDDISKFAYTSSATNAHIVNIDVKIPSKIPKITSPF